MAVDPAQIEKEGALGKEWRSQGRPANSEKRKVR